eukprot:3445469-Amphidinium_carterae.2
MPNRAAQGQQPGEAGTTQGLGNNSAHSPSKLMNLCSPLGIYTKITATVQVQELALQSDIGDEHPCCN